MRGYTFRPEDLYYVVDGYSSSLTHKPAYQWETNPGSPPIGFGAIDGKIYLSDATRPSLLVQDGQARIRDTYTLTEVKESHIVVGGERVILRNGHPVGPRDQFRPRIVIGVKDKHLVHFYLPKATAYGAALVARSLGCHDAMLLMTGQPSAQGRAALGAIKATPLPEKVLVIDPGHGGQDPGASGNGMIEKEINIVQANELRNYLRDYDVLTLLTREGDQYISLDDRCLLANCAGADVFVSLHHNAYNGTATGYEDFIRPNANEWAKKLQQTIQRHVLPVVRAYGLPNRGAKTADFRVLMKTEMPAILLEWLFMDNPKDAQVIKNPDARKAYLSAVAKGLVEYMGLRPKDAEPVAPPPRLYRVQVGAFENIQNAQTLVSKLKGQGYDAYIVS